MTDLINPDLSLDLDLLASHLKQQMQSKNLSLRAAAEEIGCSPATLSRMLKGSSAPNMPESLSLFRAVSWLGKSITDFEKGKRPSASTLIDVEVHLRALPGLTEKDKNALVALVKAAHNAFATPPKKR